MLLGDRITPETLPVVQDLIRIADGIDAAVDAKAWAVAAALFYEAVAVELPGHAPASMTGPELCALWAANLGPKKTSFHLRGNHQVHIAGDTATLRSHGYAWNRMAGNGEPLWEVWGVYVHNFTRTGLGWRCSGFAFTPSAERGNDWVKTTPG